MKPKQNQGWLPYVCLAFDNMIFIHQKKCYLFLIFNIVACINELLPLHYIYASLHFSAFHLSYNMILNQMRCEDGDPENLLRNSFYQFQADRGIPDLEVCLTL